MSSNVLKLDFNSARWILACAAAERVTKSPDYAGGFVCLRRRLDECQSWWTSTLRAMPPWRHNLCALRLVERQLTSFPIRHWNVRNLTLQQECYLTSKWTFFRTFAWLYNAAASPASRLRSAGNNWEECAAFVIISANGLTLKSSRIRTINRRPRLLHG